METERAYGAEYYDRYARNSSEWKAEFRQRREHYDSLLRIIRRNTKEVRVIADIGCGLGMLTNALVSFFGSETRVIAGDVSQYAVEATRRRFAAQDNVEVRLLDAENLDIPTESADVVAAMDVVEHLSNPNRFISHAHRILRSQGLLLFSTPNPGSLGSGIKGRRSKVPDAYTWFAWRDATHVSVRTIDTWRKACGSAGFARVRDGTDLWWDTPYVKGVPLIAQKIVFNGSYRLLMPLVGIVPWRWGENYIGLWRKP